MAEQQTAESTAEETVAGQQADDNQYEALLEEEPKPEEGQDTTTAGTGEDTVAGEDKGDKPAEGEEAKPPKEQQPGTPDKALQKMQQDLAATQRMLATIFDKVQTGEPLTKKEEAKLEEGTRKIKGIREAIEAKNFDLFDHGEALAQSVLETDETVEGLRENQRKLETEVDGLREEITWDRLGEKYKGVKVKDVWEQALKDAEPYARFGEDALQQRADELFHGRCAAAKASIEAKAKGGASGQAGQPPKRPSVVPPTPITPGGAKVTVGGGTTRTPAKPKTADEVAMEGYMGLLEPDKK